MKTDNGILFSTNKEEIAYKSEKMISDMQFNMEQIVLEYELSMSMN